MINHIKIFSRLVETATDIERENSIRYTFNAHFSDQTIKISAGIETRLSMGDLKSQFHMSINDITMHRFSLTTSRKASIIECFQRLDEKHLGENNRKIADAHKFYEAVALYFNIEI